MSRPLVNINIDGYDLQVEAGMNVIEAAKLLRKEIPHYCYHPKLTVSGNCRMCLIEMGMIQKDRATGQPILDPAGKPSVGWFSKPAIACATQAVEGLYIKTDSPLVKDCQNGVMEFLLINHPLDCPICDQAGECSLQEFATDYGRGYSRFVEEKNVKPKKTALGPRVTLDDERCILCSRCVRFCQEILGEDILGFVDRGSYSTLTCYPGKELTNNYSLNTVDICPVGALTSTDFRFKMRVWFLKRTHSICTESSVGVNTEVWSREGKIYRITPRQNDAVNDTWMSDSGREIYKHVESESRLIRYEVHGNKVSLEEALECAREHCAAAPEIAYVASARMSLEEQFAFKQLVAAKPGPVYAASHMGRGDGLLISEDRTPNTRGLLVSGLIENLPVAHLSELAEKIRAEQVKTLIVCNEDLAAVGLTEAELKKVHIIYLGTHENATSACADVVLPTLMVFEKSGSFVNQQFRLQKFAQAIPGPAGIMTDTLLIGRLCQVLSGQAGSAAGVPELWQTMAAQVPALVGITYASISAQGVQLDASAWKHLKFPESKTLHYDPALTHSSNA